MIERLFRGKGIGSGKWIEGFLFPQNIDSGYCPLCICSSPISANDYSEILGNWAIVSEDTIGLYTGEHDKNGKRVFTDCIVTDGFDSIRGIIRFGEYSNPVADGYHIGFYIEWGGKYRDILRKDLGYWAKKENFEVIGNIHDNPGLMEDKP